MAGRQDPHRSRGTGTERGCREQLVQRQILGRHSCSDDGSHRIALVGGAVGIALELAMQTSGALRRDARSGMGAIVGGLIIGIGEKVFEVYWGGLFGGGVEAWFAYMLALVFLVFRPAGLAGLNSGVDQDDPATSRQSRIPRHTK